MGFLDFLKGGGDADDGPDDERRALREQDVARVEAGTIPLAAEQRLRELAAGTTFTSGLSVADFALTRLASIRPVCQVMGTSVYKVGWQSYPWTSGWGSDAVLTELTALTHAWNDARARAVAPRRGGAHRRLPRGRRRDVRQPPPRVPRRRDRGPRQRAAVHLPEGVGPSDRPVLTDLSMPDYILLRRAGYVPVGVVTSTSVFYVVPSRQTQRMRSGWQRSQPNQEMVDYTQGVYEARERAIGRATEQAAKLGAGGLVGMQIEHEIDVREVEQNNQQRKDLIVTFHIIGTAIAPQGAHRPLDPQTILRLGVKPA